MTHTGPDQTEKALSVEGMQDAVKDGTHSQGRSSSLVGHGVVGDREGAKGLGQGHRK